MAQLHGHTRIGATYGALMTDPQAHIPDPASSLFTGTSPPPQPVTFTFPLEAGDFCE